MSDFKPGEIVDIAIKGVRVVDVAHLKDCELGVAYQCDYGEYGWAIPLGPPDVTVERVAPTEWPPRPGDLWRNRKGNSWFAVPTATGVRLISNRGVSTHPDDVLCARGPLKLVHREDES